MRKASFLQGALSLQNAIHGQEQGVTESELTKVVVDANEKVGGRALPWLTTFVVLITSSLVRMSYNT